ncbi:lecithin retinol acyltransferase family protein [Aeromonas hydrophila]|uniref:lecithin retinol acyltransferase family protein n=1 Tax=Aeromonas hydrophila TaxID=644 RepID=UPI003EC566BB
MPLPQLGDHLVSPRTGYQHHGLYLGGHQVIHYQGVSAGIHSGQIAIATLAEFGQGHGYRIQHHSARAFNREESIDRAYSRLGEAHYSTLFNNCEHFVLWCIEGFHYSKQINQLIATGCIAHQALRTVARQPTLAALPGIATSTALNPSTTTVVTAAVGALLGSSATSLAAPLAATYGLYRAWRWFRD